MVVLHQELLAKDFHREHLGGIIFQINFVNLAKTTLYQYFLDLEGAEIYTFRGIV